MKCVSNRNHGVTVGGKHYPCGAEFDAPKSEVSELIEQGYVLALDDDKSSKVGKKKEALATGDLTKEE